MIRFLIISLFSIVTLSSCALKTTEGMMRLPSNKAAGAIDSGIENPYFSNPEIDYVYKAKIEVYNKNFGGILIIKKTGFKSHRVVFTTEFGSKLFDFQYDGDSFTKNFVVEDLDRKFIINILKYDFKLLITEKSENFEVFSGEYQYAFKTKFGDRFNFYFFDKQTATLEKIINTSKVKEKVVINFASSEENIADSIGIKHKNIKLKIHLEKFKKE